LYGGENAFLLSTYTDAMLKAGFAIEVVLAPLSSVINYAPYTEQTLKDVIADRLGGALAMQGMMRRAFSLPGLWSVARKTFSWVDRRPGRLYSFVCTRP
jgi:hypothetical protein